MDRFLGQKTVFIGGGRMGEAIFSGLLSNGILKADDLTVLDVYAPRREELEEKYGLHAWDNTPENLQKALAAAEVLVLAIMPQMADPVLRQGHGKLLSGLVRQVAPLLNKAQHTVISIIGGVTLDYLESYIAEAPVVRVMPNTPARVHAGAAGVALGKNATQASGQIALDIFNAVGIAYLLPESLIDPLTSVSGCGPAYAYLFIEAMADGGVEMGLSRDMALKLAAQTLIGAGKMVMETGEHPGALKDNVCSPGGATIAGVHALEQKGFRGAVADAVVAGVTRMREVAEKA